MFNLSILVSNNFTLFFTDEYYHITKMKSTRHNASGFPMSKLNTVISNRPRASVPARRRTHIAEDTQSSAPPARKPPAAHQLHPARPRRPPARTVGTAAR